MRLAAIGIAAVVAAWWAPRLTDSLALDETLAAWITSDGLDDAWSRAQEFQGNSPLYFCILWAWRQLAGDSELALRLPSVAASLAAAGVVYHLGCRIRGRATGAVAALALVASVIVTTHGIEARPYGFEILLVVSSTAALMRWADQGGRTRDGLVWVAALVGATYMHPFAALMAVPHGIHLFTARRRGLGPPTRHIVVLSGTGTVVAAGLLPQLVSLAGRSADLVVAPTPGVDNLVEAIAPSAALVAVAVGALVARGWATPPDPARPTDRLLIAWATLPPLALFAVSNVGGSVFLARYLMYAVAGGALVVALAVTGLRTTSGRVAAVVVLVVASVLSLGRAVGVESQDWREAMEWSDATARAGSDPVLLVSTGLIESQDSSLLEDPEWVEFLSAPSDRYLESDLETRLLPVVRDEAGDAYVAGLLDDIDAGPYDIVLLVTNTKRSSSAAYDDIVTQRFGDGWSRVPGPDLSKLVVVAFSR